MKKPLLRGFVTSVVVHVVVRYKLDLYGLRDDLAILCISPDRLDPCASRVDVLNLDGSPLTALHQAQHQKHWQR